MPGVRVGVMLVIAKRAPFTGPVLADMLLEKNQVFSLIGSGKVGLL
jgi:hypothetical protein